jgi:SAM-dependent methyltransferase
MFEVYDNLTSSLELTGFVSTENNNMYHSQFNIDTKRFLYIYGALLNKNDVMEHYKEDCNNTYEINAMAAIHALFGNNFKIFKKMCKLIGHFKSDDYNRLIHYSVIYNRPKYINVLLNYFPIEYIDDIDIIYISNWIIENNHTKILKKIIKYYTNSDGICYISEIIKVTIFNSNMIFNVMEKNRLSMMKLLLKYNIVEKFGYLIDCAIKSNNFKMFKLILKYVKIKMEHIKTVIDSRNDKMIDFCLKLDIIKTCDKNELIIVAFANDCMKIVKYLHEKGFEIPVEAFHSTPYRMYKKYKHIIHNQKNVINYNYKYEYGLPNILLIKRFKKLYKKIKK